MPLIIFFLGAFIGYYTENEITMFFCFTIAVMIWCKNVAVIEILKGLDKRLLLMAENADKNNKDEVINDENEQ